MRTQANTADQPWVIPVAAMGVVATVSILAGPGFGLLPFFTAGPALAAARGTGRTVLGVGAFSAALCLVSALADDHLGNTRTLVALGGIAFVTAAACYVSSVRLQAERDLVDVREVAEAVQDVLVPPLPTQVGPLTLADSYLSATRSARVGGDLSHAVPCEDGVRVMIADVQGKGIEALRTAAVVLHTFRDAASGPLGLREIAPRIEEALATRTDGERFVTGVIAEARNDGSVDLLNYGHAAPLIRRADGHLELARPAEHTLPLGLSCLAAPQAPGPAVARVVLAPEERILFYTDGLSEARDDRGEFYPLQDRAGGPLSHPGPDRALQELRADVDHHTGGGRDDDSVLLLLQFEQAS
ncbi:serine/threonine-protein phosphatase [Streptomyces sp. NBC_01220]|uniref:PP2C family protein-serine/threonine phosphatase n=1 Tax=unclassified Streptomyces TaxID=2593676 RepID=UPI0034127074|nr:serine/threonine-protein phosphatase [Streptomyces sp. NBC_01220]